MKDKISNHPERFRIPWNLIGQIVLALVFFYLLSRLITSVSFAGRNGMDAQPTQAISSAEIFDNFGFKVFDTKWNESTWAEVGSGSQIKQLDGILTLSREVGGFGGLVAHRRKWLLSQINYVESRLMLSSDIQTQAGEIGFEINPDVGGNQAFVKCGIQGGRGNETASILCNTAGGFSTTAVEVSYDSWHLVRFEVDSENGTITFFVDGQNVGKSVPQDSSESKNAQYSLILGGSSANDGSLTGFYDYVQFKNR
jgi:outer membrane lipoprotein SlyB